MRTNRRGAAPPGLLDPRKVIEDLHLALVGRKASESETEPLASFLAGGGSVSDVVVQMLESPECQLTFFGNPSFRRLVAPESLPEDMARLYVSHIPKTAGTSLRMMLKVHFDPVEVCDGLTLSELLRLSPARLRSFRFITGHFGPVLPPLLRDVPLVTATMMRDPVAIIPSIYGQWRAHGPAGHPITVLSRALDLDDWCRAEELRSKWSNPQARALALPRVAAAWPGPTQSPEGEEPPIDEVSDGDLRSLALGCLDAIDIVGNTEDLTAVYRTCADRLGVVPRDAPTVRENVSQGPRPSMSEETRSWLLAHNIVDAELVDRVRDRRSQLLRD